MSRTLHENLARLEILFDRGNIPSIDYKRQKLKILLELQSQKQTVKPVYKDKRKKVLKDPFGNEFNYVPSSPFLLGSEFDCSQLKAGVYMAKYPVTVKEFLKFLDQSGWDYPEADRKRMALVSPEPDCPVCHVSWLDGKEYCRWLRKETGEYYSLPTEIEWEMAARGVDGRPYPWGYEEPDASRVCFQGEKNYENTVPVGSFPTNISPFNCVGMVGNVWEWCLDSFDDSRDPHILRGGSWCNGVEFSSCVSKTFSYPPEKRIDYGGLRIIFLPQDMLIEYRQKSGEDEDEDIQINSRVEESSAESDKNVHLPQKTEINENVAPPGKDPAEEKKTQGDRGVSTSVINIRKRFDSQKPTKEKDRHSLPHDEALEKLKSEPPTNLQKTPAKAGFYKPKHQPKATANPSFGKKSLSYDQGSETAEDILEFIEPNSLETGSLGAKIKTAPKNQAKSDESILEFEGLATADFKRKPGKLKVDEKQAVSISDASKASVSSKQKKTGKKTETDFQVQFVDTDTSDLETAGNELQTDIDQILKRDKDKDPKEKAIPQSVINAAYGVWCALLVAILALWTIKLL